MFLPEDMSVGCPDGDCGRNPVFLPGCGLDLASDIPGTCSEPEIFQLCHYENVGSENFVGIACSNLLGGEFQVHSGRNEICQPV